MAKDHMRAIRFHDYGGPDALMVEQVPRPHPQADQVRLRVIAAGVNPFDWVARAGLYKEFMPLPLPWIPGIEGAGIVEHAGHDVTTLEPGQSVYGVFSNAYAEYAVAPASDVAPKPAHLTFEEAASTPLGALTAWGAVIDTAKVQAGQQVLVHGAAGGVGVYALQLAKWKGAHVVATASAANVEFVRALGADEVIDYTATPFEKVVKDVDVVVDTVGGDVIERSWPVLRPGGLLVTVAARLAPEAGKAHGVRATSAGRASPANLRQLTELFESRQLRPVVGPIIPLSEASKAHELSQSRHGRGRIILLTA
jgi:NADPH:quinone reductase-like Zn-dependent oxidoreductase